VQTPARAPAVAHAPVRAMLDGADELARQWAIALVRARPLEQIGEVPLADLARDGPSLLARVVRALESDAELELLAEEQASEGADPAHPGALLPLLRLAGAREASATVLATEALREVLWEALRDELGWPSFASSSPRLVADLGDRLACVCATALAAALAEGSAEKAPAGEFGAASGEIGSARSEVRYVDSYLDSPPPGNERARAGSSHHSVALVDEWLDADVHGPHGAREHVDAGAASRVAGAGVVPTMERPTLGASARRARAKPRPRPWDTPFGGQRAAPWSPGAAIDAIDTEGGPVMRVRRRTVRPDSTHESAGDESA
jgi:hypothetical protein